MQVVSGLEVYKAYLSNVRKPVDVLIEFVRAKSDTSSPLLQVVKETVNKCQAKRKEGELEMSSIHGDCTSPMANFAYILNEMREAVKNKMSAGREMTADERAVEKFCKDMIADWANCLARQYMKIGEAVLDFCNAFTLVYPPNDKDCPALLAGAFEEFKEAMGIETVKCADTKENTK